MAPTASEGIVGDKDHEVVLVRHVLATCLIAVIKPPDRSNLGWKGLFDS